MDLSALAESGRLSCNICGGPTRRISRPFDIPVSASGGWEHDSTMRLLELESVEVSVRFCARCLYAFRSPKFDTSALYGEAAFQVRKAAFEISFPDRKYGEAEPLSWSQAMHRAGLELRRLNLNAQAMADIPGTDVLPPNLRILDWGGGTGAFGTTYAKVLQLATGRSVESSVYDPAYSSRDGSHLSHGDLVGKPPFHVVVLSHVLEHTHDPVALLRKATGYLADGGLVIAEVPDERMNYLRCAAGIRFGLHYHVAWFTLRSLVLALRTAGMQSIRGRYHYRSSYHGQPMTSILAFGLKSTSEPVTDIIPAPSREVISLSALALRKIFERMRAAWP